SAAWPRGRDFWQDRAGRSFDHQRPAGCKYCGRRELPLFHGSARAGRTYHRDRGAESARWYGKEGISNRRAKVRFPRDGATLRRTRRSATIKSYVAERVKGRASQKDWGE